MSGRSKAMRTTGMSSALGREPSASGPRDATDGDVGEVESSTSRQRVGQKGVSILKGEHSVCRILIDEAGSRRWCACSERWRRCRPASAEGHVNLVLAQPSIEQRLLACNQVLYGVYRHLDVSCRRACLPRVPTVPKESVTLRQLTMQLVYKLMRVGFVDKRELRDNVTTGK